MYQQQSQPLDAVQAYICAVQFDKSHPSAWINLGILYESYNQPRDALTCYLNASRYDTPSGNLANRTPFLQQQLASAPVPSITRGKSLLNIDEAWNLPVAADINQKTGQRSGISGATFGKQQTSTMYQTADGKRFKTTADTTEVARPQFYLTGQQIQLMHYFQQNQANLTPQQLQQLQHLQQNYRAMQQHQFQLKQQQSHATNPGFSPARHTSPQAAPFASPNTYSPRLQYANGNNANLNNPQINSFNNQSGFVQQQQQPIQQTSQNTANFFNNAQSMSQNGDNSNRANGINSNILADPSALTDQELQELVSQKEFTESFAEDLLNRLAQGENVMDEINKTDLDQTSMPNTQFTSALSDLNTRLDSTNIKQELDIKADGFLDLGLPSEIKLESSESDIHINMSGSEINSSCRGRGASARNMCMLGDENPPPCPPPPPSNILNKDQLVPPTASVLLDNKKVAFSSQLQEFCFKHPIAVVRNMASALKMDLGLFSTKTLVQTNPDDIMEVRTQIYQPADRNYDIINPDVNVWSCYSHRSHTTISKYAHYQSNTFQEQIRDEKDRIASGQKVDENNKKKWLNKTIKFGTNVDLSDEKKWRPQLQVNCVSLDD